MRQLHDVDLKWLRVFVEVVKCGGFSAAQASLNSSQSTISEQMTALETRLDLKLCERGRGGFRLTDHGRATYAAAQRLLLAVETFCMDTSVLKQRISGRLYLGVIDNTITDTDAPLPRALKRFLGHGHDVQLDMYVGSPAELEARVLDGRLHVAIGHFPLRVSGLVYTPLYDEFDGLFCAPGHPLHEAGAFESALFECIARSAIVARGYLQEHDVQTLRVSHAAATVDNVEAQAMLILSGAYIGFLPLHYAQRWVESGALRQVGAGRIASRSSFAAITRRGTSVPAVMRLFVEDLQAECPVTTAPQKPRSGFVGTPTKPTRSGFVANSEGDRGIG